MTEEEKSPSLEQIAAALNKRVLNAKCSYCSGGDLQILMHEDRTPGVYAIYQWNNLRRGMPVYAVGCLTCGHPHFFSKKIIDAMVTSDGDKGSVKEG